MPENTVTPSAWRISAPGPVAIAIGTTPRMKAKAVIRMGRRRRREAFTTASTRLSPASSACLANSQDRKSVVKGKSVSVSVDLGGRRVLKKQRRIQRPTRELQYNHI